jgi:hypothetical protein
MEVRSGDTPVPDFSWSSWTALSKGASIPDSLNARYIQYQATFIYENPSWLPILFEVSITLSTGISEDLEIDILLNNLNLSQNYPNPFHSSTLIRYSIPTQSQVHSAFIKDNKIPVRITVSNVAGRHLETLVNGYQNPGTYQVVWNGSKERFSSGIYFYRLEVGDVILTRKMTLFH